MMKRIALALLLAASAGACGGGEAAPPPGEKSIAVATETIAFGAVTVGETAEQEFRVENNGSGEVTVALAVDQLTFLANATGMEL